MPTHPTLPDRSPHFGLCFCYPAPGIVERIGPDWDWIWIDAQHGQFGYQDVLAMVRACDLIRRPAFVRVAAHDYGEIGRALDMGAAGIIVPCVDSVEQARAVVNATKFPPLGGRSYGGRRVVDLYGRMYADKANQDVKLIAQIETPLAMSNANEIAELPGIDALFLGPDDLLLGRGIAADRPRTPALLADDLHRVARICQRHGKLAGTVATTPEMAALVLECGYNLIAAGSDAGFLASGSKKAAADLRAAIAKSSGLAVAKISQ